MGASWPRLGPMRDPRVIILKAEGDMSLPGARDRLEKAIRALREATGTDLPHDGEIAALTELDTLTAELYGRHVNEMVKAVSRECAPRG